MAAKGPHGTDTPREFPVARQMPGVRETATTMARAAQLARASQNLMIWQTTSNLHCKEPGHHGGLVHSGQVQTSREVPELFG